MDEQKELCSREKYWSETSTEQKVERLAELLRRVLNENVELNDLVGQLTLHSHADGRVVTPIAGNSQGFRPKTREDWGIG